LQCLALFPLPVSIFPAKQDFNNTHETLSRMLSAFEFPLPAGRQAFKKGINPLPGLFHSLGFPIKKGNKIVSFLKGDAETS